MYPQLRGLKCSHDPPAQASVPLQTLPSSHGRPSAFVQVIGALCTQL